jgi:GT2 family glycosyltransferase
VSLRVSIIIVNWNGRELLQPCLDSLHAQTYTDFEIVVVDNGSTDGSVELLQKHYPWVRLIRLQKNTGFATGNNIGYANSAGEYIITLNNDTQADPQWLEELVAIADAHPRAGMVGCRICSFHDPDIIDSLGFGICLDGMSRGRYRLRRFSSLQMQRVEDILLPSACAALYRRAMIEDIGFFDEDFFAYCEDTDLGLRGRWAGWEAILATNSIVYHKYSETGGSFTPFKLYLVERNHYWVALKNFPMSLLILLPLFTLIRYIRQVAAILSATGTGAEFVTVDSKMACMKAILKGTWDALKGVPSVLKKRKKIMKNRKIFTGDMVALLKKYRMSFGALLDGEHKEGMT